MDNNEKTRMVAVSVFCSDGPAEFQSGEASLDELAGLVDTAGGEIVCVISQNRGRPDTETVIGEGKAQECALAVEDTGADMVVFDNELSPSQIARLEDIVGVPVIDRSMLILDIFALHARSGEGKLQVELAQLRYTMPRLMGKGRQLSRLGGGIGTRGPGETKLEADRRHLRTRIAQVRRELQDIKDNRREQRRVRDKSGIPLVAIIGYTNAGKSSLLNSLTDAGVLAEDKLFATLDPTTRRFALPGGLDILLTDTVGFIRRLPHHLIDAFSSTLDELRYADFLINVVDISDPNFREHMDVTLSLAGELGAGDKPVLTVYNKCDLGHAGFAPEGEDSVMVSARTGEGMDELAKKLAALIMRGKRRIMVLLPYSRGAVLEKIYGAYSIERREDREDGVYLEFYGDAQDESAYAEFAP